MQCTPYAGRPAADIAHALYERLDDEERLWLLDGDGTSGRACAPFGRRGTTASRRARGSRAPGHPRDPLRRRPAGLRGRRGHRFPVVHGAGRHLGRRLEERVGEVIGREVRAQGGNFFGGVCINLPRHPAWGRAQETYGDDPHHLGEFGAALAAGRSGGSWPAPSTTR